MRDYAGFWYSPNYGYELYENGQLVSRLERVAGAACFSKVFHLFDRKSKQEFEGIYTLRCKKVFETRSGNYCSLEKSQVLKVLRYMRTAFQISVSFKDTEDYYVFIFKIQGKPIKHKFILTFSRVFFEFPYNEMARDIFKLREAGPINGINYCSKSFLEIYHVLHAVYSDHWGGGHSLFCYPSKDVSLKTLKKAFEEGLPQVHEVFTGDTKLYDKIKRWKPNLRSVDWDNDFDVRASFYAENFQIIKDFKQNGNKKKKGVRRRARKVVRKVD